MLKISKKILDIFYFIVVGDMNFSWFIVFNVVNKNGKMRKYNSRKNCSKSEYLNNNLKWC